MIADNVVFKNELPEGWTWINLGNLVDDPKQDLVDGPFGSNLKSCEYQSEGVPVLKIQNIKNNRFVDKNIGFISKEKANILIRHSFKSEDLIITKLGNPLGACCKVPNKYTFGIIVADLMRLRPGKLKIINDYLLHAINSEIIQKQFKTITKGTTRPRVNLTIVREIEIPLPPLHEQQRIVAKIEELFSELDNGVEALKTVQQQLKVYRQAVLKWAFEGKLTEGWRKRQRDLPTASQLLEQIKDEREKITRTNGNDLKSIVAVTDTDLEKLPQLRDGWAWIRLNHLGELARGKSKHRPRNDKKLFGGQYPFIQTAEIKAAKEVVKSYKNTYSEFGLSQSKLWPKGTLCITIAANIAETAFLGFDSCFPDSVVGISTNNRLALPKFIYFFFKTSQKRIEEFAPATAQKNINLDILENLNIPYCSFAEQIEVIQEIETRLSVADKLEEAISQSLRQAEALRQSILKKAFEGKLVPQDPNDEPASKLLERIKAEKAAQAPARKARKKKANP